MVQEQTRKGPWTEQEDNQLVFYVNLFGDRRWDFIAKVSGLKRTGKSCRLRWVNYLHPDLKSGKLTIQEERLVLELHTKWGNRWSRIARKLPGRTDNEIKNYWRTYTRKKAQEKRKAMSVTSTTTTVNSPKDNSQIVESITSLKSKEGNICDTTCCYANKTSVAEYEDDWGSKVYPLDEIWRDFELSSIKPVNDGERYFSGELMGSPVWDVSLWGTHEEEEESMMFTSTNNHL